MKFGNELAVARRATANLPKGWSESDLGLRRICFNSFRVGILMESTQGSSFLATLG
jgi:hypothetical protein